MRNRLPFPSPAWNKINQCRLSLRFCSLISLSTFGLFGVHNAKAANRTWSGGGGDNNWGTATNWDAGIVNTDSLFFAGITRLTPINNTTAGNDYNITFNSGAGAFTLSGNAIELLSGGNVTNSSANAQIVNIPISLLGSGTFSSSGGALTIGGDINETGNVDKILAFNGAGDIIVNGLISNNGSGIIEVTKSGLGKLTLSASNAYAASTTINGGVLSVGILANGNTGSGIGASANLAANLVLGGGTLQYTGATVGTDRNFTLTTGMTSGIDIVSAGTSLTISGASANTTGALTKTGAGTLTLSGANGHLGLTTVSAGTLAYGLADALSSGAVTVNGGTLDIKTFNDSVGAVTLTAGSINGTTGVLTGTSYALNGSVNTSVSAILGGAVTLTKSNAGTATLSGNNTYTGVTTISGGTLSVATIGNGGVAGNLGQATNAAANLVIGNGTLQYTGANASTNRAFTITTGQTATFDITANNLTVSGASPVGTGALTKIGAGTLTLSGANGYTGLTTVSAGTLAYGINSAISSGAVTVDGGILDIKTFSDTVGAVTLTAGSINGTTGVLTGTSFALNGSVNTSVSAILGGAGALTKTNAGTATLTGVNTYTGTTTVSAGTLQVTGTGSLSGTSSVAINGGTLLVSGTERINNVATQLGGTSGGTSKLEMSGAATETLGILTLSNTGGGVRVIDFGAGGGSLTFTSIASSALNVALQIWNWTASGGTADQLIATSGFGANTALTDITFYSDGGTTSLGTAKWVSGTTGTLVPVPEPGALFAGLALMAPLAWRERRHWMRCREARPC